MLRRLADIVMVLRNILGWPFRGIREINRRYSKPRIHESRMVRVSLLLLRIYLLIMVGILIYKFVTLLR